MRILTVVKKLGRGGTERAAEVYSRRYQLHGHQVAVLARLGGGVRVAPLERSGVQVFVGSEDDGLVGGAALEQALAFAPDVVHIHRNGMADESESRVMEALAAPARKIIETNVFGRVDPSPGGRHVDVSMQLSAWCLWRWRRWLFPGLGASLGVVVPYPVESSGFTRSSEDEIREFREQHLEIPSDSLVLGRIGQRLDGKWHPAIIDAYAELAREDPRVHLATIGMPESCRNRLAKLPEDLQRRAIDIGYIDNDKLLATVYSRMDVFVHAAQIGESFGYVLAEAMLCGTPVVAASRPHKDNSQVEVVGHEVGGLVTHGVDGLAGACRELLADPERRRRLGESARRSVIERFDAEKISGLALRVVEHAGAARDARDLRRRLAEDPELVTRVPRSRIRALLQGLHGPVSWSDRLLMEAVVVPGLHRLRSSLRG